MTVYMSTRLDANIEICCIESSAKPFCGIKYGILLDAFMVRRDMGHEPLKKESSAPKIRLFSTDPIDSFKGTTARGSRSSTSTGYPRTESSHSKKKALIDSLFFQTKSSRAVLRLRD